ncbi:MAG TPA: hypothetical protein VHL79_15490 [Ramlibacter sp.]|nr:hypothetical protein [Ramlibacter sp.]
MDAARQRSLAGWCAIGAGGFIAWMVHRHPEGLRAPAFVAYAAAAAFALAGLSILAGERWKAWVQGWAAVVLVACLVTPAVWIAFGSGERRCSLGLAHGLLHLAGASSETACRVAFGIAAVLGVAILLLYVRHALRASRTR